MAKDIQDFKLFLKKEGFEEYLINLIMESKMLTFTNVVIEKYIDSIYPNELYPQKYTYHEKLNLLIGNTIRKNKQSFKIDNKHPLLTVGLYEFLYDFVQ